MRDALLGHETVSLIPEPDGILQVVTVPIAIGLTQPQILGSVSVGFLLNEALASQLKAITGSDVAFGMDGRVLTTTLPREHDQALVGTAAQPRTSPRLCSARTSMSCCPSR